MAPGRRAAADADGDERGAAVGCRGLGRLGGRWLGDGVGVGVGGGVAAAPTNTVTCAGLTDDALRPAGDDEDVDVVRARRPGPRR